MVKNRKPAPLYGLLVRWTALLKGRQAPRRRLALRARRRRRSIVPHQPRRHAGRSQSSGQGSVRPGGHRGRKLAKGSRASTRRRGWLGHAPSSRSALRALVVAQAEGLGLPTGQRPPAKIPARVGDAFGRHQPGAGQRPAAPFGPQGSKVAQAHEPQQLHRRPWHPVRATVPRLHRRQRAAEQIGASLAAQEARAAKLAETIGRQVPYPAGHFVTPATRRNAASLDGRALGVMQMPIVSNCGGHITAPAPPRR